MKRILNALLHFTPYVVLHRSQVTTRKRVLMEYPYASRRDKELVYIPMSRWDSLLRGGTPDGQTKEDG